MRYLFVLPRLFVLLLLFILCGKGFSLLVQLLNDVGLRSSRGNRFTVNSLYRILTNRAYIGEYKFGEVCIPDGMPRLIDDEVFMAVQAKLEANRRGGKGAIKKIHPDIQIEDYWLTGKICCGLCGGTLQGVSGTSRRGGLYYYYSCKNHRKHACKLKNQRKDLLETIVIYLLGDLLHDPGLRIIIAFACYAYYQSQNDDNGAYEESLKARLKEVEGKLANIIKAIEKGIFGDTMAEQMNVLENQKSMLTDALLAEQNRKQFDLTVNDVLRWLDVFVGDINNPDTRSKLLDGLIEKICVYPDKLVISCFYMDDHRELPFEETMQLIEHKRSLKAMADDFLRMVDSGEIFESRCGGSEEENPDFFS